MDKPVTLHPPKTAPKDGSLIIADFAGEAFPLPAFWNIARKQWVIARPKLTPYKGDVIFSDFESVKPKGELWGWLAVPYKDEDCLLPEE